MIPRFLRGFIDGSLSTLGVVIGASSGSASLIVAAAVGGTLANSLSNALGAFLASGAEEYGDLRDVERAMVTRDLRGTEQERRVTRTSLTAGFVDCAGTLAGGSVPIWPYLVASPETATAISVATVAGTTALVGVYLGRLARQSLIWAAVKMILFAAIMSVAVYLIQAAIVPDDV